MRSSFGKFRFLISFSWAFSLIGCSIELGESPFECNDGTPECPSGYECMASDLLKRKYCVKAGACPAFIPECVPNATCGDNKCEAGENTQSCPGDCPPENCGNDVCDADETYANCPFDCKVATGCGNGVCDPGEDPGTCSSDCTPTCGNKSCDPGETSQQCPGDCPPTTSCPNGTCDSGETNATCPQDCPPATCTGDESECDGTDSLKSCEGGVWNTESCESLCLAASFEYSMGCEYSSTKYKDVCKCGTYVKFGGVCDDLQQCDPALFCGIFGTDGTGFCTKYCTNLGGTCSGAPSGSTALCDLPIGSETACGFFCSPGTCPTGLTCEYSSGICKP